MSALSTAGPLSGPLLAAAAGTAAVLITLLRRRYTRRWAPLIVQPAELVSCLMSVRMLRGIKQRAESALLHAPPISVAPHSYRPQPGSYCDVDQRADAVQASMTKG